MKTGEAAKILGVDRTTIVNWIENRGLDRFFTPSAAGADGATQRMLTESDLMVLNTIRTLRSSNLDWPEIAVTLDSGHREREFPQNAISADSRTVPVQQAEVSARALATVAERDAALARVDEMTEELNVLKAHVAQLQTEKEKIREEYFREIVQLNRLIGKLEGQLEIYREPSKDKTEDSDG